MKNEKMHNFIKNVLENMPSDWLRLTTHRLDIYDEKLAKTLFLDQFEALFNDNNTTKSSLNDLSTAYDYIRLGHPLSCILEWIIAKQNQLKAQNVISFSSNNIPILAILRKNLLENKATQIIYKNELPDSFDTAVLKTVYGYQFDLKKIETDTGISEFDGSTIFISQEENLFDIKLNPNIDFFVQTSTQFGSILLDNGSKNENYISEIQHVRRRETIAMTPANCLAALQEFTTNSPTKNGESNPDTNKKTVLDLISKITEADTKALLGSCGLSVQYAIMMGLIDEAQQTHKGKAIKIVVPPNCYGGTNDQARRVAACIDNVEVVDLPVDGDNDMVQSIHIVLDKIAQENAIPFIIAEIPTNPRVEVPNLLQLKDALNKERKTNNGGTAVEPVFILDQTFCPNVHFLGENEILASVKTIAYVSGSKFPSGGLCTAGYCIANLKAANLMGSIEKHLKICDNEVTYLQVEILAKQLPSMNQRIEDAYQNTREFVNHIQAKLPEAKINFVSNELAAQGFTPSVFSLDLPTKGTTDEERETYKRKLNHQLISLMIAKIPDESKHCVSYGQLKGCYWTIPATSTQGTTKEGDKDYIVRVALSPNMDIQKHKEVFSAFVENI